MTKRLKPNLGLYVSAAALLVTITAHAAPATGDLDGDYSTLGADIDAQQTDVNAAQDNADTQIQEAADAQDNFATVRATLTNENLAAFDAVTSASAAFDVARQNANIARLLESDAFVDTTRAEENFNSARINLRLAQLRNLSDKTTVSAAQNAYDSLLSIGTATPVQIVNATNALITAIANERSSQAIERSRQADETTASNLLVFAEIAFQEAINASFTARMKVRGAELTLFTAQTDLQTSLASNTALGQAFADVGLTVLPGDEATALTSLSAEVSTQQAQIAPAQAALTAEQTALAVLNRQDTILTDAAGSAQENIALASGALTGDPAAAGSNFETEALGALTDHENRIATNTADIGALDAQLNAEATAREAGDADTLASANANTADAVAAEAALRISGDADTLASANANTANAVAAEVALRTTADTSLQSNIDAEATTRAAADTALAGRITTEEAARAAADTTLQSNINTEATTRAAADAALAGRLTTEEVARAAADTTLQSNINAEATTRAVADTALAGRITTEEVARAAADTTLQSNINAEATTRAAADTALAGRITTEEVARAAADTAIGVRIATEETARAAADTAEIAARISGDAATLTAANAYTDTSVSAEAATRAAADTAEIAVRIAADTALGGRITTEVTDRTNADTAIGVRIATEETARAVADTAIGTRITTESNARIAADLAETNARIAGDNALGSRITDETNARIAADSVLRDQIASSTATAIALGGNAMLPDVNFTLAGNMGFYNGATAVSINAASKVGSSAYVTAAVGGGLNKQGKVGGRVGVVFGF